MFSNIKSLKANAKSAVAAAGLLALSALTAEVTASPFAPLSGSWAGGGTITTSSGTKERIRCRAKYDVSGAGSNLDLTLRCASDSYNFELQSNGSHSNGAVSGTWSERPAMSAATSRAAPAAPASTSGCRASFRRCSA